MIRAPVSWTESGRLAFIEIVETCCASSFRVATEHHSRDGVAQSAETVGDPQDVAICGNGGRVGSRVTHSHRICSRLASVDEFAEFIAGTCVEEETANLQSASRNGRIACRRSRDRNARRLVRMLRRPHPDLCTKTGTSRLQKKGMVDAAKREGLARPTASA